MNAKQKKPAIVVIGALQLSTRKQEMLILGRNKAKSRRKKIPVISRHDQGFARVLCLHESGHELDKEELAIAERSIARCSAILLLQNAAVGVALQAAALAKKHHVNVMIDPEPMLHLTEKIRRAAEQIMSHSRINQKKRSTGKKWRKKRIKKNVAQPMA
jgi:hypothetical protein